MPKTTTASEIFEKILETVDEALLQAEQAILELQEEEEEVENDENPAEGNLSSERNCSPDKDESPPKMPRKGSKEKEKEVENKRDVGYHFQQPPTPDPDPLASPPSKRDVKPKEKKKLEKRDPLASPPTSPPSKRDEKLKNKSTENRQPQPVAPPLDVDKKSSARERMANPSLKEEKVMNVTHSTRSYMRLDGEKAIVMTKLKAEEPIDEHEVERLELLIRETVGKKLRGGNFDSYILDLIDRK